MTTLPAGVSGGGVPGAPMTPRMCWGVSCFERTSSRSQKPEKSRDGYRRAVTKPSLLRNLAMSAGFCGRTKQQLTLRQLLVGKNERQSVGYQASSSRRSVWLSQFSRKCSNTEFGAGTVLSLGPHEADG